MIIIAMTGMFVAGANFGFLIAAILSAAKDDK